jgi:transposase-like protein
MCISSKDEEQASGNHRNGKSRKRVLTDTGTMEVSIPRDRQPQLIEKYRRRLLPGFQDNVIALYARGMTPGRSRCMCVSSGSTIVGQPDQ